MTQVQQFLNSFDQTVFVRRIDSKGKQIKGNASIVVYDSIRFISNGVIIKDELEKLAQQIHTKG